VILDEPGLRLGGAQGRNLLRKWKELKRTFFIAADLGERVIVPFEGRGRGTAGGRRGEGRPASSVKKGLSRFPEKTHRVRSVRRRKA